MSHLDLPCPIIAATPDDAAYFVGFHDICPWAPAGDALAVLRVPKHFERLPGPDDKAEICLWYPKEGRVETVGETTAWNLQQGTRLQWVPAAARTLAWNIRRGDRFHGVMKELITGEIRELPGPIYGLHPAGRWSLAPSFARLNRYYESYGYAGGTAPGLHVQMPQEDGIWRMDLETGETELVMPVSRAAAFGGLEVDPPVPHFVTHPTWNPAGTHFCFIHRYFTSQGEMMSRLFVCDAGGEDLRLISDDRVSHFDWYDNDRICVWARIGLKPLGALRNKGILHSPLVRPLVRMAKSLRPDLKRRLNNAGYWMLDIHGREEPELIVERIEDGHQMFSADRRWMLTDTYPDERRTCTLMLFDLEENRIFDIARLHAPPHTHHDYRCDLHPRWNRTGDLIAVDSDDKGFRQVLIIDPSPVFRAASGSRKVA